MPKYRALYVKIIDSFDFNEMPDDFTRVTWMLLTLIVDSAGRGIDSPAWIRSKMYPLREDVTLKDIEEAQNWYANRGMIARYEADGKRYFEIINFTKYQLHLEREAKSNLPANPSLKSNSGVTQEKEKSNANAYAYESVYESESESAYAYESVKGENEKFFDGNELNKAFTEAAQITPYNLPRWLKSLESLQKKGTIPDDITEAVRVLREKGYTVAGPWSLENAVMNIMGKRKSNNGITPPPPGYTND